MYLIESDSAVSRLTLTIDGLLSSADVGGLTLEIEQEAAKLHRWRPNHTILCDYTKAIIQPQIVINLLQELARSRKCGSRKVALYTGGQLAKAQARRIAQNLRYFELFDDHDAAVAWLNDT